MKIISNLLSMVLFVAILLSCSGKKEHAGRFSFESQKPISGENITIYFNADSTKLAKDSTVKMFAYFFNDALDTTVEKTMSKNMNVLKATIKSPVTSRGVIIKFTDGNEKEENNNQKGYVILFSDKSGEIPPEAKADLGIAYIGWGRVGGMARNYKKALNAFDSAFKINPELKNKYLDNYFEAMWKKDKNAAKVMIKNELDKIRLKKNKTDADYLLLWTWYGNIGENVKSEKYKVEGIKKFPKGKVQEQVLLNKFRMGKDYRTKKKLSDDFLQKFPNYTEKNDLYDDVAYYATKTGNKNIILSFFSKNAEHIHPYYFSYAGKSLAKKGDDIIAEKLYEMGVEHAEKIVSSLSETLPNDMSIDEYQSQIKYYLGINQFGIAEIYLKKKNSEKALSFLKEAVANTINYNASPKIFQAYIHALVDLEQYKEALVKGERFIKEGNTTNDLLNDLRTAYIGVNDTDKGFEEYVNKNKDIAKEKLVEKIKGELVDEYAPDFTLKDLDGKDLKLSTLKGKIVILDFWATWCGPCLRSFPAMNRLANKYENSGDVVFLFINTWEKAKDKVQNVKDFAKKNNYNLEFLVDSENKVVTDYKVTGIPTKVFIGMDGNIKMRSIGFAGNTDQLVEEVKIIIDIIKKVE